MRIRGALLGIVTALAALPAGAQLPAPNESGVSTGHVHFTVPDRTRHAGIWTALGGNTVSSGGLELIAFPGIYVLLTEGKAAATSIETAANHVGFSVKDFATYRATLEAQGATFFFEDANAGQILADLPDGIRIEILTDPQQAEPIVFHHMHIAATAPFELRDWYMRVFGAKAGERRGLPSALVPGGRVDILPVNGGAPRGSQGGAFDHIGFEVADMDAFAAHLESIGVAFDMLPRRIEAIGLTIAFLTDPAGTYIEVTQGLATRK